MIVAVTGGTGFIGSAVVEKLLLAHHEVRVLTRDANYNKDGVTPFLGDLLHDNVCLDEFVRDVDVLYHCCGELSDETTMDALHVSGTKKLLNAATGNVKRWVQLSSVGAYGCCRHGSITEVSNQEPVGEYERTKAESDELVQSCEIPHVVLRPSIVFGSEMPNNSLRQFASAIETGKFFFMGKRGAILNYAHVDEVVNALVLCGTIEGATGNTYIVSQSIQLEDMVNAVLEGSGSKRTFRRMPEFPVRLLALALGWSKLFPLTTNRINALTGRCTYDSSKIVEQLGFKYESTLKERLQSFVCTNKTNNNKNQN